jgi:hypothetical protein
MQALHPAFLPAHLLRKRLPQKHIAVRHAFRFSLVPCYRHRHAEYLPPTPSDLVTGTTNKVEEMRKMALYDLHAAHHRRAYRSRRLAYTDPHGVYFTTA